MTMMKIVMSPGFMLVVVLLLEGVQICMCTNSAFDWIEDERHPQKLNQSFKDPPNRKQKSRCIEGERQGMMKLKQSFDDPSNRLVSWRGENCCEWKGVSCNKLTGHVVKLDLSAPYYYFVLEYAYKDQLSAAEVDYGLTELKHLEHLDLSGNSFNGTRIPDFFGSFKNLTYLNLSHTGFEGKIPHQLGNLTNLQILDISDGYSSSGSQLHTSNLRWASRLSSLGHLDMSGADLGEAFDLMHVLSELPSLRRLTLQHCGIQNIHFDTASTKSTFLASVRFLDLKGNEIEGEIPRAFHNLTSLRGLDLSYQESGGLNGYKGLSSLSSLQHLDMSGANFSDVFDLMPVLSELPSLLHLTLKNSGIQNNHFSTASINSTFLSNVQSLDLSSNLFVGPVPKSFHNMTSLRSLYISRNKFNSIIPLSLVNHVTLLNLDLSENKFDRVEGGLFSIINKACSAKLLDLSNNNFGREVLISNKNLSSCINGYDLEFLSLEYNQIGGNIPDWFGQLMNLKYLRLCADSLSGPIPLSFGKLSKLRVLDLTDNQLNDSIPHSLGSLLALESLYLSGNQLSHSIPQSLGSLLALEYLDLSDNQLSGSIPHSFGNLLTLGSLYLSRNNLSGSIPQSLGSLSALKSLDLSYNQLRDSIPQSLGRLLALESLDLSHNQLIGIIPKSLSGLVSLTALDLSNNKLSGHVPESIGQLVNLMSLDISLNSLDGVFSQLHLANLSKLYTITISSNHMTCNFKSDWIPPFSLDTLNMSSCVIGSQFPPWIHKQEYIRVLDLANSNISGALPTWRQPIHLSYLDLSNNHIIGNPLANIADNFPFISTLILGNNLLSGLIPNSLCKLGGLQVLDLSENELFGEMPRCWKEMQPLVVINLSSNKLSGSFPSSFGQLSNLKRLHVNRNKFRGKLPQALRNCTSLELLDLGENDFTGFIPPWFGKSFSTLRILRLRKNTLDGGIPKEICDLHRLQILDLAENNLIGDIPVCFGNLSGMRTTLPLDPDNSVTVSPGLTPIPGANDPDWKRERLPVVTKGSDLEYTKLQLQLLGIMDLSSNKLTGVIPAELCSLFGLHGLNLSNNQLSGKIPNQIGELKSLETLDFSNNRLFGPIPQKLSALHSISHLNLSNNDLSGKIPQGNQLQTLADPSIYAGNAKLCGDPLPKKCDQPPISSGHEKGDEGEDKKKENILFWFVVTTGYALGLWGVIGTLVFKKNWRIAYFRFAEDKKEWILAMIAIKVARLKRRMQWT